MRYSLPVGAWFRPSLAKVGLFGIALCLALGAYAPPASTGQARQAAEVPEPIHTAAHVTTGKDGVSRTGR